MFKNGWQNVKMAKPVQVPPFFIGIREVTLLQDPHFFIDVVLAAVLALDSRRVIGRVAVGLILRILEAERNISSIAVPGLGRTLQETRDARPSPLVIPFQSGIPEEGQEF